MWGVMHGEAVRTENGHGEGKGGAATAVNPPNLNSLMELLNTVKDGATLVDMSVYDSLLKDVRFTMIHAWTSCSIQIAGFRFQLEKGSTLNIGEERKANPAFDMVCRATSPGGSNPDECIILSSALWKCTRGAEIQLFWQPHRSYSVTAGGFACQTL